MTETNMTQMNRLDLDEVIKAYALSKGKPQAGCGENGNVCPMWAYEKAYNVKLTEVFDDDYISGFMNGFDVASGEQPMCWINRDAEAYKLGVEDGVAASKRLLNGDDVDPQEVLERAFNYDSYKRFRSEVLDEETVSV